MGNDRKPATDACRMGGIRSHSRRRKPNETMRHPHEFRFSPLLPLLGSLAFMSCRTVEPPPPPPQPSDVSEKKPTALYEWKGDGVPGPLAIRINTNHQKAYLTKGGKDVGWTYVATGLHSHPTPVGNFRIQEKTVDKRSNLWGKIYNSKGRVVVSDARNGRDNIPAGGRFQGASMRYWMRLTGDGIGMHSGPIPRPGNRASHGCIRLPSGIAPVLFRHAVIGTPVTIVGSGPKWKPSQPPPKPASEKPAVPAETAPDATPPAAEPESAPSPAPEVPSPPETPAPPVPENAPAAPANGGL